MPHANSSHSPPRKAIVATALHPIDEFRDQEGRIAGVEALIEQAASEAARAYPAQGLDLMVLPEEILTGDSRAGAPSERAVLIDGPEMNRMHDKARAHRTYLVVPLTLRDSERTDCITNAAVLLDRSGNTAGIYHKYHPVADRSGKSLEGGITPGHAFPVFDCDFGKLGIQICWDMSYEDGWLALAKQGAEIVALSSASPQTARPASYALRGQYYVISSTHRHNASLFNPLGRVTQQITKRGVMVTQIDLAYALLHWSPTLNEGRAFKDRYADRVDYLYYGEEDTGLFWSNDNTLPIRDMVNEMGEVEIAEQVARSLQVEAEIRDATNSPNR